MIPVYLKISGFLSYQEPVELSFDDFDLACISGANGAGKSSLLDAITWVLFGQARKRDDSLINSHSNGAEVIYDFQYEGDTYRVQRSKVPGKSTLLDFYILGSREKWRTLSERTLRETESRIEETLRMDFDTFTNASFFLQGKADQFAQQRPGDRKRILGSILGLEVWETYRERTVQRRRFREEELTGLDSRLDEIEKELAQEEVRKMRLQGLQEDLEQVAALRKSQEEKLDQQRQLAASLAEQNRLLEVLLQQLETSRKRQQQRTQTLAARHEERNLYLQQIQTAGEVDSAFDQWQQLRQKLEDLEKQAEIYRSLQAQRSQPMLTVESERSRLKEEIRGLRDTEVQVQELEQKTPAWKDNLKTLKAETAETLTLLETRVVLEDEDRSLQETVANAAAENKRMKLEMQDYKQRIDQLENSTEAVCPLCGQPLQIEERQRLLEELEVEGKKLGDRYRSNQDLFQKAEARRKKIQESLLDMKKLDPLLRQQQRQGDQIDEQLSQAQAVLENWEKEGKPRLNTLQTSLAEEKFAPEARAELAKIDLQLQESGYDPARHEAVKQAEQKMRTSEEQKREVDRARAALEPLNREIEQIENELAADQKGIDNQEHAYNAADEKYQQDVQTLPDIPQEEKQLFALLEKENRIRDEIGAARQEVEVLKVQKKRKKEYLQERESITLQIARLKTLERAFSKDGVPALLIEQALPEIEAQANEILERLSAGGMSVRFETQQEYKDKKREDKKETLDILISDAAGMRDYSLFSGGEAFRVNFSIRLALSRVLAQRAGARLQTLVIDEGFGSQDNQGRQRLIEAINMVRDDFEKILVITHLEELKDAFPARIEVTKTVSGSQLEVIV
jgi:exonuclease SbcC